MRPRLRTRPNTGTHCFPFLCMHYLSGRVVTIHFLHRSITDRSKVLLASFCENDIGNIVKNIDKPHAKNMRVNRIRNGISDFLQSVCDDIVELYPNIVQDNDFVLRLFKRMLENTANPTKQICPAQKDEEVPAAL